MSLHFHNFLWIPNVHIIMYLGKQSKKLSLFRKCFWGGTTCLKHTKYQFKFNESNPFGKKYCDGPHILDKFCYRPDQVWMEAPKDHLGNQRDISYQNEKSLEYCKINETLTQCDGSESVYCDDTNIVKPEENRAMWSKYISLKPGFNVR